MVEFDPRPGPPCSATAGLQPQAQSRHGGIEDCKDKERLCVGALAKSQARRPRLKDAVYGWTHYAILDIDIDCQNRLLLQHTVRRKDTATSHPFGMQNRHRF
jgi:hypothetical protein